MGDLMFDKWRESNREQIKSVDDLIRAKEVREYYKEDEDDSGI